MYLALRQYSKLTPIEERLAPLRQIVCIHASTRRHIHTLTYSRLSRMIVVAPPHLRESIFTVLSRTPLFGSTRGKHRSNRRSPHFIFCHSSRERSSPLYYHGFSLTGSPYLFIPRTMQPINTEGHMDCLI